MGKIIALSGFKGSGKDTVAQYLAHEYLFEQQAFADVLKDMVSAQYNIPRSWCDDPIYKETHLLQYPVDSKDKFTSAIHDLLKNEFREYTQHNYDEVTITKYWTPRALCILEGSIKRSVNSNYWTQQVINNINLCQEVDRFTGHVLNISFVISDLRYRSEVEQLRKEYGKDLVTVRINRFDSVNTTDPSEVDLIGTKFDVTIDNKGSLEDLYKQLDNLMGVK
jgi:hypothetical protein